MPNQQSRPLVAELREFVESYAIGSNHQEHALAVLSSLEEQLEALRDALDKNSSRTDGDEKLCWCSTTLRSGLFVDAHDGWCRKAREAFYPAISPVAVGYEADSEGRLYALYDNGDVLPTGKVSRAFAGKSNITPERYAELFPASEPEAT